MKYLRDADTRPPHESAHPDEDEDDAEESEDDVEEVAVHDDEDEQDERQCDRRDDSEALSRRLTRFLVDDAGTEDERVVAEFALGDVTGGELAVDNRRR